MIYINFDVSIFDFGGALRLDQWLDDKQQFKVVEKVRGR